MYLNSLLIFIINLNLTKNYELVKIKINSLLISFCPLKIIKFLNPLRIK